MSHFKELVTALTIYDSALRRNEMSLDEVERVVI
jgi:hypothetical protein